MLLSVGFASVGFAQVDPKTGILEQAGFEALDAGQPHAAAEAFRQAMTADPKNPHVHLGAGIAALRERRDEDAKSELATALALDPKLTQARRFLGLVYYRLGDLPAAIAA